MDEPTIDLPGAHWGHWRWLLLLVVLAGLMRVWQITHTEVATRDSIAFIGIAWRLENQSWPEVIRTSEHHPLYPILIHLASGPVCRWLPEDRPRAMQLAAQLVSCLAGVLLVVPMYWLGCELFDRRVGFWAALLYQCLPPSGRVMPDGLTEPVFLLLAASALLFACKGVRTAHWGWYALAGLTTGLAYLTRTEGLLLAAVTALVLLGMQISRTWRRNWWTVGRCELSLILATLLVAGPFMLLIKGVSLKPALGRMLDPSKGQLGPVGPASRAGLPGVPPRPRVAAQRETSAYPRSVSRNETTPRHLLATIPPSLPFASWMIDRDIRPEDRYFWSAGALGTMIDKGFFHVLTLPVVVGLWLFRRRFAQVPGLWLMLVQGIVLMALLYWLGQSNGYLGERHVLLIVMGGLYWGVAALGVLAGCLARWVGRGRPATWALLLLVTVALLPLPKTLARLHAERSGFKQAGQWLARTVGPDDELLDPFGWAKYYAGRCFRERQPSGAKVYYVVLDHSRSQHPHLWYLLEEAKKLAERGEKVRTFEVQHGKHKAEVFVYRVRL
jgi:hypothetical protein